MQRSVMLFIVFCCSISFGRAEGLLKPCDLPGLKEKVQCGSLEVWENREARSGRKIPIRIVVLPATGKVHQPDPVFFLSGGPGEAATEDAAPFAEEMAGIRGKHDLVFVDQRGTGGSNPLNFDLYEGSHNPQVYLERFFPLEAVKDARPELEKHADLTQYTTSDFADDLDEVRAALGYERINILGGSYGTRAALEYLRRHGNHVRTALLQGVVPPGDFLTLQLPRYSQRALDLVLEDCEKDAACHQAFPAIRDEARAVFDGLARKPADVLLKDPDTGETQKVKLSRDVAAEGVRYMLYSSMDACNVPLALHQAAQGDLSRLAQIAIYRRRHIVNSGSNGLYLSVTCAEDLPWIKAEDAEKVASGTFIGDYRWRDQHAACELWPRGAVSNVFHTPVQSDVPTLLITGFRDPATPPEDGAAVAGSLPNSLHIIVPDGGHSLGGLTNVDCIDRLIQSFIESGTTRGLDTSCVATIHRPPFRLKWED